MDFSAKLHSTSVRDQLEAAIFLRSEGAKGSEHLPLLLKACQAIDPNRDLDRYEEALLGMGAMTLGGILAESGLNGADPIHNSIVCWIVESTSSSNIRVAGHSLYALGSLGAESSAAKERLCDIVVSNLRGDEHEHVSLRAVALRLLRRIDHKLAATFVDTPAFEEYRHAIEHWIASDASRNDDTRIELQHELDWLIDLENRQTKP